MKQTSRGLAPSLNTGHSTFTGARQRLAVALVAIVIAFAGAQTAWAQKTCYVTFYISSGGTVELPTGEEWLEVTNGEPIDFILPSVNDLTITPETGYYVSSVTYDAPDGLIIDLNQRDDFHWYLYINPYEGSKTPTITVYIVFDKALAGGADEASAVALTADNDLSHLTGGWYKVESDLTFGHTVNLHGDTHITIATGKTLTVNTSDKYGIYGSALTVSGEGMLNVSASKSAIYVENYTQTGCAVTLSGETDGLTAENNVSISGGSLTTSGAIIGIETNQGAITISGGTVSASGDSAGLYACDAVSITGGTVSASGNNYGIRGYSVSITGGQVTASSGGIRSNYGDITLGLTSATDYITASGFTVKEGFYMKIADGQTLYGGGFPSASYTGTVGDPSALNGLMLRPTAAVTKSGTNEYTIHTAAGWGVFCDALLDNDTYNRFSGKTVKLGADITISRMAGASQHDFCGTFDGDGHTLTFNYGTSGSYASDEYAAPFHYVSNVGSTAAAFRNLHVAGHIYTSAKYAAGLIAQHWGTVNVENCRVSTVIHSSVSGDGTHGGIEAVNIGVLNITGCVFDGKLLTTNGTDNCGGFVGWHNGGTTNISNSLYAPAAIATGEREAGPGTAGQNPSATFGRNAVNSIANSYYTRTLGTAQGKQAHSITASGNATLVHAGVATEYSVSGITAYKASGASGDDDPFIAGIIYNNVLYAGSGDEVSLTLGNTPPDGYSLGGYTTYTDSDDRATLTRDGDNYRLTMPDADVTIGATFMEHVSVSYIDANGKEQTVDAIPLQGGGKTTLAPGWYVVNSNVTYTGTVTLDGNVNIILADGKTMNANDDEKGIDGSNGTLTIYGQTLGTGTLNATGSTFAILGSLTMTGGTVNAGNPNEVGSYAIGSLTMTDGIFTAAATINVSGGTLNATAGNAAIAGNVTVTGGTLTATATAFNIAATRSDWQIKNLWVAIYGKLALSGPATVTLNGEVSVYESVTIAGGLTFTDGTKNYSGTLDIYDKVAILNKTLTPVTINGTAILYDNDAGLPDGHRNAKRLTTLADNQPHDIMLMGRTLYKDGDWNTLCLPFALGDDQAESGHELDGTPLEGATLMTLGNSQACNTGFDPQTGTLTLDFLPATTVEPGVAYIVKWPIPDGMTADEFAAAYAANPDDYDLKNPVFTGVTVTNDAPADHATTSLDGYVTFIGTYGTAAIYADPATNLYLGAANKLYWPSTEGYRLGAFRAYFQLGNGLTCGTPAGARAFVLNFGDEEATGILSTTNFTNYTNSAAAWYDMQGRKLSAQPTARGIYIHGGKKVVIK